MSKILVSGLVNIETTTKIKGFPVEYYPIDYPFFGVNTAVAGVAYNVAKALKILEDDVDVCSMTGTDFPAEYIAAELDKIGLSNENIKRKLKQTPNTVVLYDEQGKRQIYCDLKDIQDTEYSFEKECYTDRDIIVACNINFNRDLLVKAHKAGKVIATDVHVLSDINDSYNSDFMRYANILFLSDEGIDSDYREFLISIEKKYENDIIVLGMGKSGALMYVKEEQRFYELSAVDIGNVVNTVGAGDALFSGFIHYYGKGMSPKESLIRAQIFAAVKIQSNGAAKGFANENKIEDIYKIIMNGEGA